MNLYNAADSMILADSFRLSHCFGLAIPHTHENGKADEKTLTFRKSKMPVVEISEEINEELDTCVLDDHKPGSAERIEELRNYYDATFNQKTNDYTFKNGEKSPFVLTDEEAIERFTDTVWHWQGEPTELITAIRESMRSELE